MAEKTFLVKSPKSGRELSITKDFGNTTAEAVELFKEEVVFSNFQSQAITNCGNNARRLLNQTNEDGSPSFTLEEVAEKVAAWIPGIVTRTPGVSKDPVAALVSKISSGQMSDEELADAQAKIKGALAERRAAKTAPAEATG